jgi:succinate dehydrogenase/fumarate reductase flavoprotein subunit
MIWNTDLIEALEYDNLISQAAVTVNRRPTARKAAAPTPARTTPSATTENWMKHTLAWNDGTGKVTLDYRPVHDYTMSNEISYIEPKARVY